MSDIVLSKGVRQNLLSLQNTAALLSQTQERLSTGKKVNSALDNPINFFTASGLQSRANDLNRLLDSIGNAVQTVQAADKGISAITKLLETAQATARQALTAGTGDAVYDTTVTGNTAIDADTTRATSGSFAGAVAAPATASVQSSYQFNATAALGVFDNTDGNTMTFSLAGGPSVTFEFESAGGVASGNVSVGALTAGQLEGLLAGYFGAGNVDETGGVITLSGNFTNDFTVTFGGTDGGDITTAAAATNTASIDGDKLTLTVGATTETFRYVATGAVPANGTFTSLAELVTAIDTAALGGIDATAATGNLQLDNASGFTVGGAFGTLLGLNQAGQTQAYSANFNADLDSLSGELSISLGSGQAQTIDFDVVKTRSALVNALAGLTGVSASLTGGGEIEISWDSSEALNIGGAPALALFAVGNIGANAADAPTGGASAARASLQNDYNLLLSQITQLARDASFNGVNLINGDNLTVQFNEDGSSSLTINGVDFTATGLQLTNQTGDAFQTNGGINAAVAELDAATATLRSQASAFGSNLSIIQARQDFTKNMITVLQIGADNLVLADSNEEGANMLALNTRQQLSTVALSLAAQADQNVLRLF